jgi:hypothetical protein
LLNLKKKTFVKNRTKGILSRSRLINKDTIQNFLNILKNETWDNIYGTDDINDAFNSFLSTFLVHFPVQLKTDKHMSKEWITSAVRVSCRRKQSLFILTSHYHCSIVKTYYNK